MKTYYDPETTYSIITDNSEIISVQKRRLFKYDHIFTHDNDFLKYAMMGTAFHSGKPVNHMVRYADNAPALVNLSGAIKFGILQNYSVCSEFFDEKEFIDKNFYSFYTPEVELMPLLGYVVKTEKTNNPKFSFYEGQNHLKGEPFISADPNLPGDNLGQMCQILCNGSSVKNSVCTSVLQNPFYGKILSLSSSPGGNPVAIMRPETFNKYFKGVPGPLKDVALFYPVVFETGETGIFGKERIKVFLVSENSQALSHCIGFVHLFSNGGKDIIFSYDDIPYEYEAGYNGIFK